MDLVKIQTIVDHKVCMVFSILYFLFFTGSGQSIESYHDYTDALQLLKGKNYDSALKTLDLAIQKSEFQYDTINTILFKLKKSEVFRATGQYDSSIILLSNSNFLSTTQSKVDINIAARVYFEKGASLISKGDLKTGRLNISQAILLFTKIDKHADTMVAQCYSKLGNYFLYNKQYDSALIYYQSAYNLIKNIEKIIDLPNYLINLGIGYFANGFFQESENSFLMALDIINRDQYVDHYLLCKTYFNLGLFYYNLSNYENSLIYFSKAEKIASTYTDKGHIDLGNLAWNKSLLLLGLGDVTKASQYILQARLIFDNKFAKNNPIISALNMDQALIYESMGLRQEAVELYRKSLLNTAIPVKLKTYRNLAKLFMKNDDLVEAGKYFDSCFYIIETNPNISPLEVAYTELYFGDYLIRCHDKSAIKHLNSSFELFINIFGIKHRDVAYALFMMGDHYLSIGKIDLALYYYHQSIISITPSFHNAEILSNPEKEEVSIDQHSIKLFEQKAKTLTMVFEETKDIHYLESLLDLYDLMIHTIEQFIKMYRTEDGRMLLSKEFYDVYKNAVQANVVAYELSRDHAFAEKAFELSEKSKSAILLAELKDENAKKLGLVPDYLYELEKSLRGNLYLYKKNIIEEEKKEIPNEGKLVFMRSRMFQDEKKYDSLISIYENEFPEYFKLKYDPSVISIAALQKLLEESEVMIEYTITKDHLITFVISNTNFVIHKNELDSHLVERIFSLRNNLDIPHAQSYQIEDFRQFQTLSSQLYQILFKPVCNDFKGTNVIIIPDEELAYLSFEALTEYCLNPDTMNFKNQPYLLKKYAFSYEGSATIYSMGLKKKNPTLRKGILSMAPTYPLIDKKAYAKYGDFGGLLDLNRNLPGALEEAEYVLKYIRGEKLSGESASEATFKKMAADYDILHFAMHTRIDDSNPLSSQLSFYPFGDSIEDDVLHTYEIYNMRLNGHLAVLSACSTGSGALQKGEGVMSLARAFAFAGMPSIIMTLWDVEDIASREIIPNLYYALSQGSRKDEALRLAKLNHLKSVRVMIEAHPAFWAGHVLYGNKKPFMLPVPISAILLLVLLGTLITVIIVVLVVKYIKYKKYKPGRIDLPIEF